MRDFHFVNFRTKRPIGFSNVQKPERPTEAGPRRSTAPSMAGSPSDRRARGIVAPKGRWTRVPWDPRWGGEGAAGITVSGTAGFGLEGECNRGFQSSTVWDTGMVRMSRSTWRFWTGDRSRTKNRSIGAR